ncbi:MAG: hypothetical protein NT091_03765, partial [Candidatus Falkowbacteria bacterium]|nr:hypothetical protein [Candidatus Falkowbacteria bacterium]
MHYILPQIILLMDVTVFLSVLLLHLSNKNKISVWLYAVQSIAIAILMLYYSIDNLSALLLLAILSTMMVKIIIAPYFFFRLIKKCDLKFSVKAYLNAPITLLVMAVLVLIVKTNFKEMLISFNDSEKDLLLIALISILTSIFLIINRKGALSQMIGVLSLENSIVLFAIFSGLEQKPSLQLGIT